MFSRDAPGPAKSRIFININFEEFTRTPGNFHPPNVNDILKIENAGDYNNV
jgi:hypothetical protein